MKRESLCRMVDLFEKVTETVIEEVKAADLECDDLHRKDVIDFVEDTIAQTVDILYSIAENGGAAVGKARSYTAIDALIDAKNRLTAVSGLTAEDFDAVCGKLNEAIEWLGIPKNYAE